MISSENAEIFIKGFDDYYNALIRSRYRLPIKESKLCTYKFLQMVRDNQCWVPRLNQVVLSPCPEPPSVFEIQQELLQSIRQNF